MPKRIAKIFEASHKELQDHRYQAESQQQSLEAQLYAEVLAAYLSGDVEALVQQRKKISESEELPVWFLELFELRLQIRTHSVSLSLLEVLAEHAVGAGDWQGEIWFVVAMGFETLHQPEYAKQYYELSARSLSRLGAEKKAIKARLNAIVAESRMHPEKKLLAEYYFLYKDARRLGQNGVAGVAFLNISREYQKMGAHLVAMKYCNRALALQKNEVGTLPYFLTLAHRAHLNIQLGRASEAQLDYEQAIISPFPEVKEALEVVKAFREKAPVAETSAKLTPTWRERSNQSKKETEENFSGNLENRLLELLADGPKDRHELCAGIWGDKIDFLALENRLKNLLNRMRKRFPDLIVRDNNRYRIADSVYLETAKATLKKAV